MTDNEIMEALKACNTQDGSIPCYDCPCWCDDTQKCVGLNYTEVLGLINRQKAEIEELKRKNEILSRNADNAFQEGLNECRGLFEPEIKAEAYKEFAERIRECCASNDDLPADAWLSVTTDINCVLKEMVGEEK